MESCISEVETGPYSGWNPGMTKAIQTEELLDQERVAIGLGVESLVNDITGNHCAYVVVWIKPETLGASPEYCANVTSKDAVRLLKNVIVELNKGHGWLGPVRHPS